MKITDRVYGETEVKEPVLLELLKSPSVVRLKKISQFGVPDKYYHHKNYSRYEHSVGVMLFLRRLGATIEEQIAGLLHDVSVLAFSHVTDWVFSEGSKGIEDFHDSIHEKFVRKTEIPEILEEFDLSTKRVLDEKNFTLLENKIPNLCADRVDYALRECKYWLNPGLVKRCLVSLVNFNGEIVFTDRETAFDFAKNFLKLQTEHWGGYEAVMRYYLFSKALKIALEEGIISKGDFYRDEDFVLGKLEKNQRGDIEKLLSQLKNKKLEKVKRNSGRKVRKKFRYVDPKIISNGKLVRLSSVRPGFQEMIEKHQEINRKGLLV